MTAEIVIMNRSAVALAADSAVTQQLASGDKIFTSANKLFALSRTEPVAIMVYGSADFMGVPWETLIKAFRAQLGTDKCPTVEKYGEEFVDFLTQAQHIIPLTADRSFVRNAVTGTFASIRDAFLTEAGRRLHGNSLTESEAVALLDATIDTALAHARGLQELPHMDSRAVAIIFKAHADVVHAALSAVFEQTPLTKTQRSALWEIAGRFFIHNGFTVNNSGVVIAGFGTDQFFPQIVTYRFEGRVGEFLKYEQSYAETIQEQADALILPLAQREMVETFMEGVDPEYRRRTEEDLRVLLEQFATSAADLLPARRRASVGEALRDVAREVVSAYVEGSENYRTEHHVEPVVQVVAMLPKDELAAMAESLVNLTAFKRRVSTDSETVGGPIDVAVISKGDGLIWIKRKHYFDPGMNPQYFTRYGGS